MSVYLERALWRFGIFLWAAAIEAGATHNLRRRRKKPLKEAVLLSVPKPRKVQPQKPHKDVVRCDWCDGELLSSAPETEVRMCRVCHGKMTLHVTGVREMKRRLAEEAAKKAAAEKAKTAKEKP